MKKSDVELAVIEDEIREIRELFNEVAMFIEY